MFIILLLLPFGLAKDPHILSDEYIELINAKQNLWKAGRNYPESTPLEHLPSLFGLLPKETLEDYPVKTYDADFIASLPETFDAREKWPNCPSLKEIRDQGPCGSCWAFGAVEAMTDRWCIHSDSQFHFSAQDMAACIDADDNGCTGNAISNAWDFWYREGVVSGGNYNSNDGCRPYELPECIHGKNCTPVLATKCVKKCRDGYETSYENDKRFGTEPYNVEGEANLMAELFKNGPLEVGFPVCPDFYHYKHGIYNPSPTVGDEECGGHAVKLIGWGVENGTKYWLIANSWNTYWGELGGFFKLLRGANLTEYNDNTAALPRSSFKHYKIGSD